MKTDYDVAHQTNFAYGPQTSMLGLHRVMCRYSGRVLCIRLQGQLVSISSRAGPNLAVTGSLAWNGHEVPCVDWKAVGEGRGFVA